MSIEDSPKFKEWVKQNGDTRQFRQDLKEKYENNSEVQRNRMKSKDQTAADAIDTMTGRIKEYNDAKQGRDTTESEARKKAIEIARKAGVEGA